MTRPTDPPDIRISKTLSYILRHGAEKEGLPIRSDGFINLKDVLARPKMRDTNLEVVLRIVEECAKQRFEVLYGYDPSPPQPKRTRGRGKPKVIEKSGGKEKKVHALAEDDAQNESSKIVIEDDAPGSTELPLVAVPYLSQNEDELVECRREEYFIRATQGHSLKLESVAHLTPVLDDEEGRERAGLLVHGTRWELWETLKDMGLSRMTRQHIHLAPALCDHHITPRLTSTLFIYLDLSKCLKAGIPVYTSTNGVVLTPGNELGIVPKELWRKAERMMKGERVPVWQDNEVISQAMRGSNSLT